MYSYDDDQSSPDARHNDRRGGGGAKDSRSVDTSQYTSGPVYQAPYSDPQQHGYSNSSRGGGDLVVSIGGNNVHRPVGAAPGVYPGATPLPPMAGSGEPLPPKCHSPSTLYGRVGEPPMNLRGISDGSGSAFPQKQSGIDSGTSRTSSYSLSSQNSYQSRQDAPPPQQYPYQQRVTATQSSALHDHQQRQEPIRRVDVPPDSGTPSSLPPTSLAASIFMDGRSNQLTASSPHPVQHRQHDQLHNVSVGTPNRSGLRDSTSSFNLTNRALYLEIVGEEAMTDFAYGTTVKELEGTQFVVDHVKREAHEASSVPHLIWNDNARKSNKTPGYPDLRDTVKKLEMKLDNACKTGEAHERHIVKLTGDIDFQKKIIQDYQSHVTDKGTGTDTIITPLARNEAVGVPVPSVTTVTPGSAGGPSTFTGKLRSHFSGTTRVSQIRPTTSKHMCGLISQILRLPSWESVHNAPLTPIQRKELKTIAPSTATVYDDFMNCEHHSLFKFADYDHLYPPKEYASTLHNGIFPGLKGSRSLV